MGKRRFKWSSVTAALVGVVVAAQPVAAAIDLVWEPAEQTVDVGDTVEINLVARSDDETTQHFALLDAVILWDATYLDFLGVDDSAAGYPFLASHFMPDPDGLNDDLQDGDALFIALAPGGQEAPVPPEGLVITQFEFTALAETDGTDIRIAATMGTHARTRIRRLDLSDVTGAFSEPGVVIIRICRTGDADGDGDVDLEDFAAFQRCFTGEGIAATSDCQCHFDFDEDTDVDLSDYWEFEQRLTGPLP